MHRIADLQVCLVIVMIGFGFIRPLLGSDQHSGDVTASINRRSTALWTLPAENKERIHPRSHAPTIPRRVPSQCSHGQPACQWLPLRTRTASPSRRQTAVGRLRSVIPLLGRRQSRYHARQAIQTHPPHVDLRHNSRRPVCNIAANAWKPSRRRAFMRAKPSLVSPARRAVRFLFRQPKHGVWFRVGARSTS